MINNIISLKLNQHSSINHCNRTFVRREGRLTNRQKRALHDYWPLMGVMYQNYYINMKTLFGRDAPLILEIGFGMSNSLVIMAKNNPKKNFLGIEIYKPGIGACLSEAYIAKVSNIRIISHDAIEVLKYMIPNNSLDIVQLFFPDPWYKKRHNKRRIVHAYFAELVLKKLKIDGICHIATDWKPYAEHILEVMNKIQDYKNLSHSNNYIIRPNTRSFTKFELRGKNLGYDIFDLMFLKKNNN
ncbi:tRNA (guanine-N(7)-)-methyltransferase [Candidatus Ecksteinia adelgidicola]|nr:tRNA (guanine-N(7)-)-methyltransferase [Candidatus Ecksteinia adelgidicola]